MEKPMQIQQLSKKLDQKLIDIDQHLDQLHAQRNASQNSEEQHQLNQDLEALQHIKNKLEKSRDLAWRAHRLQHQDKEMIKMRRLNRLGLALCVISVIAGAALVGYWIFLEFGA